MNGIEPDDDIKFVARQSPAKCLLHSIAQRNDGKRDSTRLNARKICWRWKVGEKTVRTPLEAQGILEDFRPVSR